MFSPHSSLKSIKKKRTMPGFVIFYCVYCIVWWSRLHVYIFNILLYNTLTNIEFVTFDILYILQWPSNQKCIDLTGVKDCVCVGRKSHCIFISCTLCIKEVPITLRYSCDFYAHYKGEGNCAHSWRLRFQLPVITQAQNAPRSVYPDVVEISRMPSTRTIY